MPYEPHNATYSFDLVRLAHTKREIGIPESVIRAYIDDGFHGVYKRGKARFVSKSELEAWIKGKPQNV